MRISKINIKPHFYWAVHLFLVGPLVILWAGVAYWFGFGSGVILKMVFPPMSVPLILGLFPVAAFVWTVLHLKRTPRERSLIWGLDVILCVFLGFSMLIVAGQIAAQ